MKKLLLLTLFLSVVLAACGGENEEKKSVKEPKTVASDSSTVEDKKVASLADPRLQEPTEDTVCEMCNMKVYMKDHEMGVFSTQAIKEDGTTTFYDDIGCLLNAEVANGEKNEKFVRDYRTKEWAKVEDVTIVKTELKSPMNWGYIYFIDKEEADKYIKENPNTSIAELQKIKDDALERRKKKMQEKESNGEGDTESSEMHNDEHGGHK